MELLNLDETIWPSAACVSSPSVSVMVVGRAHCPGLHCSSAKECVDRGPQQVDGSSDVENRLPLLDGVLQTQMSNSKNFLFCSVFQTHTASLPSHFLLERCRAGLLPCRPVEPY